MTAKELVIGQRYWLDKVKDVSGVYVGLDPDGDIGFDSIEGYNCYLSDDNGVVHFGPDAGFFYPIEP